MKTYIALLRGINVSGQKKILMADLKILFETHGFKNNKTYIQSGNVIFQSEETDTAILAQQLEQMLRDKYGFEVITLIRTPAQLEEVLKASPFLNEPEKELKRQYLTFLSDVPAPAHLQALQALDYSPEEFKVLGKTIYFYSPDSYGNAKMNNNFFEKKLKLNATTRNWATVTKLAEMAAGT